MGFSRFASVRLLGLGCHGPACSPGGDDSWLLYGTGVRHAVFAATFFHCTAATWTGTQAIREGSAANAKMAARCRVILEDSPPARLTRPDALDKFQVIVYFSTDGSGWFCVRGCGD